MDYSSLSAALLVDLRGKMSQQRVSERLGFQSNVVQLWETQKRFPAVSQLLQLAGLRRRGNRAALWRFAKATEGSEAAKRDPSIAELMQHLASAQPISEMARLTGFDRATISRWLGGKTTPRLPDFLCFVDRCSMRLLEFVSVFTDPVTLPATRDAQLNLLKQGDLAYRLPWTSALLQGLQVANYRALRKHRASVLAEHLGISEQQVESHLAALAEAQLVRLVGQLWEPIDLSSIDTREDFARNRQLKSHWAQVGAERSEQLTPDARSLFSYNVFPIGNADLLELRQLHTEYYQRIRQLVANAQGADEVVLVNVQFCVLSEGNN